MIIECKGCRSWEETCFLEPHYIDKHGIKIECPCKVCLIKGICKQSCDAFKQYTNIQIVHYS